MKRLRYYQIFRGVFADLKTYKRELRALCKPMTFKTEEVKGAYIPTAASLTTYMQSLDRHMPVDQEGHLGDLYLTKDSGAVKPSSDGGKLRGYLERVRQMVKQTQIFKEKDEKEDESKVVALTVEDKEARKRRLFGIFSKQVKRVVEIMK